MAYFPMDDHGWPIMQHPALSANPISNRDYPTSNIFTSRHNTSTYSSGMNPFILPGQGIELSGYLASQRKTRDNSKGDFVEYALQSKNIDIHDAPPFMPVTGKTAHSSHGVIKLSNIPFTVTEQEIRQFLNRNVASIQTIEKHTQGFPIHIIMEKPTGKTMDCFVEFSSAFAAVQCAAKFAQNNRGTRLGSRNVSVELSSQAELMKAIFPRARLVDFDSLTGEPTIRPYTDSNDWSQGFRGYFTLEEIHGVVRFAESPSRSPFVLKAHQRVYECMISTLYKFPWAAVDTYTVAARNALFVAVYTQIDILAGKVSSFESSDSGYSTSPFSPYGTNMYNTSGSAFSSDRPASDYGNREVGLNQTLLFDLLLAAVNVPVFSILQKTALCKAAGAAGRGIPLSSFSEAWPFQTLESARGVSDEAIRFWLELFDTGFEIMEREGTQTGFEEYLIFSRTKFGFPIAEWTSNGVELHFDKAVEVEVAVVDQYVNCGRQHWSIEREVYLDPMATSSLMEVFASSFHTRSSYHVTDAVPSQLGPAATLTSTDTPGSQGYTSIYASDEDDISPMSSRDLGGSRVAHIPSSILNDRRCPDVPSTPGNGSRYRFNAATAIDFIPSSQQEQASSTRPPYVAPMRLTIDTNFARQATAHPVTPQRPAQMAMRELQRNDPTPLRSHALSAASAVESTSFSDPFSTPSSHGSGVRLPSTGRQPRAFTYSSGISDHMLRNFGSLSLDSTSPNTRTNLSAAPRSQTQPMLAVHELVGESLGSRSANEPFPSDVDRSNLMRSLEHESKSLAEMGSLHGQPQASGGRDFGPIGSTRTSIAEGPQNLANPPPRMPDLSAHPSRAHSITFTSRAGSSSNSGTQGNSVRKLSATELFNSVYNKLNKEKENEDHDFDESGAAI